MDTVVGFFHYPYTPLQNIFHLWLYMKALLEIRGSREHFDSRFLQTLAPRLPLPFLPNSPSFIPQGNIF